MDKILDLIRKDITIYIVCLVAILICMIYYYNIEHYQQANNKAWQEWAMQCGCQCIINNQLPTPNISKDFELPFINELKGEQHEQEYKNMD
jgi:hypothetical protein